MEERGRVTRLGKEEEEERSGRGREVGKNLSPTTFPEMPDASHVDYEFIRNQLEQQQLSRECCPELTSRETQLFHHSSYDSNTNNRVQVGRGRRFFSSALVVDHSTSETTQMKSVQDLDN